MTTVTHHNTDADLPLSGREPALGGGRYGPMTGLEPLIGGDVTARLTELLALLRQSDDLDARWTAARGLGQLADPRAMDDLLEALHSGDVRLRRYVAWALGRIGERDQEAAAVAVPGLLDALRRPGGRMREVTAWALGRIGHARAVPALREALRDRNCQVRRAAAEALGRTGSQMEGDTIRAQIVMGIEKLLADTDRNVRRAAAEALGRMGDEDAIPSLFDALTHPDRDTRWSAAWALGRCGNRARARLVVALHDPDPLMRQAAGWGLWWLDNGKDGGRPPDRP